MDNRYPNDIEYVCRVWLTYGDGMIALRAVLEILAFYILTFVILYSLGILLAHFANWLSS